MQFHPYLNFAGDCAEAFRFYADLFGGELDISTFAEMGMDADLPEGWGDRVLHAALTVEHELLLASDAPPGRYRKPAGNYISLSVESLEEGRRIFDALADGAEIEMPFQETFWSPGYGMLVDRWGTPWMINVEPEDDDTD